MTHIFISYSHKDSDYARRLANNLEQEGFLAWIDERIDYGAQWPRVIQEELDTCSAFIVIMTPASYESDWVQNELSRAKASNKNIFPLLLDGESTWLSVQATQYVDVRNHQLPPARFYERLARFVPRVVATSAIVHQQSPIQASPLDPEELQPPGPTGGRQPFKQSTKDLILEAGACEDFERKLVTFMKITQLDPRDPVGYRLLAWAYQKLTDYASAIHCDYQALRLDPQFAKAYVGLLLSGNRTGNNIVVDESWEKLRQICDERERPFHEAAYWYADYLARRKDYSGAVYWFRHVTKDWWKPMNKYEEWLLNDSRRREKELQR